MIYQIYQGIKYFICAKNVTTELFSSNTGVRQGENLSPVLISVYLNDLENYLKGHHCNGVSLVANDIDTFYKIAMYLVRLLHAIDISLIATNASVCVFPVL